MRSYSDPTANAALGAIESEFKAKKKLAQHLKKLRRKGKLSDKELMDAGRQFKGIFRHIFDEVYQG